MSAVIIKLSDYRKWEGIRVLRVSRRKVCMHSSPRIGDFIDTECPCKACRLYYDAMSKRSTQDIMNDLKPLRMLGQEDEGRRNALFSELSENSTNQ